MWYEFQWGRNDAPKCMAVHILALPEKLVRASLLLLVSAMARLNCSRMVLSSDERCSVLCSATRRRSFKAWNSLWYAISFSGTKNSRRHTGSNFDLWPATDERGHQWIAFRRVLMSWLFTIKNTQWQGEVIIAPWLIDYYDLILAVCPQQVFTK